MKAEVFIFARMKMSHRDRLPRNDSVKLVAWRITVPRIALKKYRCARCHSHCPEGEYRNHVTRGRGEWSEKEE